MKQLSHKSKDCPLPQLAGCLSQGLKKSALGQSASQSVARLMQMKKTSKKKPSSAMGGRENFSPNLTPDLPAKTTVESYSRSNRQEHCINGTRQETTFPPAQKSSSSNHLCVSTTITKSIHKEPNGTQLKIPLSFQPQRIRRSDLFSRSSNTAPPAPSAKGSANNLKIPPDDLKLREFWIALDDEKRKSLVLQEKIILLKLWKEKQRLSCTCKYCELKKSTVEEEIEILYETYYQVLDEYTKYLVECIKSGKKGTVEEFPHFGRLFTPTEKHERQIMKLTGDIKGGKENFADFIVKMQAKKVLEIVEQIVERKLLRESGEQNPHTKDSSFNESRHCSHYIHQCSGNDSSDGSCNGDNDDEYIDDDVEESYEDDDYCDSDDMDREFGERLCPHGKPFISCITCEHLRHDDKQLEEIFHIIAAMTFEQRVIVAYHEHVALEKRKKLIEEEEERLSREAPDQKKNTKNKKDHKKLFIELTQNDDTNEKDDKQVENNLSTDTLNIKQNNTSENEIITNDLLVNSQEEQYSVSSLVENISSEEESDENISIVHEDELKIVTHSLDPFEDTDSSIEDNHCNEFITENINEKEYLSEEDSVEIIESKNEDFSGQSDLSLTNHSQSSSLSLHQEEDEEEEEQSLSEESFSNSSIQINEISSPSSHNDSSFYSVPPPGLLSQSNPEQNGQSTVYKSAVPISTIEDELFKSSYSYHQTGAIEYPPYHVPPSHMYYNYPSHPLGLPFHYQSQPYNMYCNVPPFFNPTYHHSHPLDQSYSHESFKEPNGNSLEFGQFHLNPNFTQNFPGQFTKESNSFSLPFESKSQSDSPESSKILCPNGHAVNAKLNHDELIGKQYDRPIGMEINSNGSSNNSLWNPLVPTINLWKHNSNSCKSDQNKNSIEGQQQSNHLNCHRNFLNDSKNDLFFKTMLLYQKVL